MVQKYIATALSLSEGNISGPEDVPNSELRQQCEEVQKVFPDEPFTDILEALISNSGRVDLACKDLLKKESSSESLSDTESEGESIQVPSRTRQQLRRSERHMNATRPNYEISSTEEDEEVSSDSESEPESTSGSECDTIQSQTPTLPHMSNIPCARATILKLRYPSPKAPAAQVTRPRELVIKARRSSARASFWRVAKPRTTLSGSVLPASASITSIATVPVEQTSTAALVGPVPESHSQSNSKKRKLNEDTEASNDRPNKASTPVRTSPHLT